MSDTARLAAEMLATADALRTVRSAACRLLLTDSPGPAAAPDVRIVCCEGLDVANALEHLAQLLGEG